MKKLINILLLLLLAVVLVGCGNSEMQTVKLGLVGEDTDVWDSVKDRLSEQNIDLEYVIFTDYVQPNNALAEGAVDINAFQTQIFLDNYNEESETELVNIGDTVIAPLAIYSEQVTTIDDLADNATVTIPNDVTMMGRALILLQTAGLIQLDEAAGFTPSPDDIVENPKNLDITPLDASQTARSLADVDIALINSGMAIDAGLSPQEDSIFIEQVGESSEPYINTIAARKEDADKEVLKAVVDTYQTEETAQKIEEVYQGAQVAAW